MKSTIASVRRRQLIIAGLAAGAMPASVLAGECGARADAFGLPGIAALTMADGDKLIVSGRVVDASCNAVAGARVELPGAGADATTDADGRFMLVTNPAHAASPSVDIRVSRRNLRASDRVVALRDAAGSWRGTLEVALT